MADIALLHAATERRLLLEWCDVHRKRIKFEIQKRSGGASRFGRTRVRVGQTRRARYRSHRVSRLLGRERAPLRRARSPDPRRALSRSDERGRASENLELLGERRRRRQKPRRLRRGLGDALLLVFAGGLRGPPHPGVQAAAARGDLRVGDRRTDDKYADPERPTSTRSPTCPTSRTKLTTFGVMHRKYGGFRLAAVGRTIGMGPKLGQTDEATKSPIGRV